MEYNITYRQKNKGWQYLISFKLDKKWKQRTKQGFRTRGDAKVAADIALENLKEEFKNAGFLGSYDITLYELKEMYLAEKKYYLAATSINNMNTALKPFYFLRDYKIKDITKDNIQSTITAMIKKGNKPITIKSHTDYVKILFNYAMDKELLVRNPTKGLVLPKNRKETTRRALTIDEVNNLLYKLRNAKGKNAPYYYLASLLASGCGLRVGEILGLNYGDFNSKKGTVRINKQYSRFEKAITDPKSQNSNRTVPVPPIILDEINKFQEIHNADSIDKIFNLSTIESFDKMINKRYKMLGFDVCIHELRHTYATNLVSNNIDIKTAAYLLGHDIKMTMNIYSHVTDEMLNNAKSIINNKIYINMDTN